MFRRPHPVDWQSTDAGWEAGQFAIALEAPGRWALIVDGVARSAHARASDAAAAAQQVDRDRRRRSRILRNGALIALAALVWTAALTWRFVPNGEYPQALQSAVDLEGAYRSVVDGSVPVASFSGPISGGAFTASPPISLGDEVVVRNYEALTMVSGKGCYVVRWSPDPNPRLYDILTGVITADLPCEVGPGLLQPGFYERSWFQPADGSPFDWGRVLPPAQLQAAWFIPVVTAMVLSILNGLIGISLAIVSPPRSRISTLPPGAVRR